MAAPPWPPRPDMSEQRSRSFPDRADATVPAAGLGATAERVIVGAGGEPGEAGAAVSAVSAVPTAQELRAVLRHRLAARQEAAR